jgi:hypothetical protein
VTTVWGACTRTSSFSLPPKQAREVTTSPPLSKMLSQFITTGQPIRNAIRAPTSLPRRECGSRTTALSHWFNKPLIKCVHPSGS